MKVLRVNDRGSQKKYVSCITTSDIHVKYQVPLQFINICVCSTNFDTDQLMKHPCRLNNDSTLTGAYNSNCSMFEIFSHHTAISFQHLPSFSFILQPLQKQSFQINNSFLKSLKKIYPLINSHGLLCGPLSLCFHFFWL